MILLDFLSSAEQLGVNLTKIRAEEDKNKMPSIGISPNNDLFINHRLTVVLISAKSHFLEPSMKQILALLDILGSAEVESLSAGNAFLLLRRFLSRHLQSRQRETFVKFSKALKSSSASKNASSKK